jgi:hypothetical protein
MTHYETLGIPEGVSADHIRSSWLLLVQAFHPDRFAAGSTTQRMAEERLKCINAAYEVLKDPYRRAAYDAELARKRQPWPAATPSTPSSPTRSPEAHSARTATETKAKVTYCDQCGKRLAGATRCWSCTTTKQCTCDPNTPLNTEYCPLHAPNARRANWNSVVGRPCPRCNSVRTIEARDGSWTCQDCGDAAPIYATPARPSEKSTSSGFIAGYGYLILWSVCCASFNLPLQSLLGEDRWEWFGYILGSILFILIVSSVARRAAWRLCQKMVGAKGK